MIESTTAYNEYGEEITITVKDRILWRWDTSDSDKIVPYPGTIHEDIIHEISQDEEFVKIGLSWYDIADIEIVDILESKAIRSLFKKIFG